MKREIALLCLVGLLLGAALPEASASVSLFLNAPEDGRGCGISDFGHGQQQADNFQLGASAQVTEVRWWGGYGSDPDPAASDSFVVRFFGDASGAPAADPFLEMSVSVARSATSMTASLWSGHDGGAVYEYFASLPTSLAVDPGTAYYLSVVNNAGSTWGWLEDSEQSHWFRLDEGGDWFASSRTTNFSFELLGNNAIPAPSALISLMTGLVCLSGYGLRRRKA